MESTAIRFKEIEGLVKELTNERIRELSSQDPCNTKMLTRELLMFALDNIANYRSMLIEGMTYDKWFSYMLKVQRFDDLTFWNERVHPKIIALREEVKGLNLLDYYTMEIVSMVKVKELDVMSDLLKSSLENLELELGIGV